MNHTSTRKQSNLGIISEGPSEVPESASIESVDYDPSHAVHHTVEIIHDEDEEAEDEIQEKRETTPQPKTRLKRTKHQLDHESDSDVSIANQDIPPVRNSRRLSISTSSKSRESIIAVRKKPKGINLRPEEIQISLDENPALYHMILLGLQVKEYCGLPFEKPYS